MSLNGGIVDKLHIIHGENSYSIYVKAAINCLPARPYLQYFGESIKS